MQVQLGFPTPQKKKTQNPRGFCMSRGVSLPSSSFAAAGERCPPWARPPAHLSPAPLASRDLGNSRALGGVGWSQEGGRVGGEDGAFFSASFFGGLSARPPASCSPLPSDSNGSRCCPRRTPIPAPPPPSLLCFPWVFSFPSSFCSSTSPQRVLMACVHVCARTHVSCLCHSPLPEREY